VVCHSLWERDFESSILSTPTTQHLVSSKVEHATDNRETEEHYLYQVPGRISLMVKREPSKLTSRVRFPYPAPVLYLVSSGVEQDSYKVKVVGAKPTRGTIQRTCNLKVK